MAKKTLENFLGITPAYIFLKGQHLEFFKL